MCVIKILKQHHHLYILPQAKKPILYVLLPSLLGLKGNLEMTLASRFSTAANKGIFNSSKQRWSMITGNMALIQVQAGTIAFIAAMVAMLMSWIPSGEFNLSHALILISASLYTAAIASLILSSLMMFIIIYSEKNNINQVLAMPVAASLSDL